MKNENGRITITVGMLLWIIVLLLIVIVCLLLYKENVNKNNSKGFEQNSYTELVDFNNKEEKINTLKYSNLKDSTLNEKDVLFITEAQKNEDNTYTLNGVVYKYDEKDTNESEINDRWILTSDFYSVTLSADLPCEMKYDYDEQYKNVNDIFKNYSNQKPENTSNPSYKNCFRFTIENNVCIGIENILTGLEIEENIASNNSNYTITYNSLKGIYKGNISDIYGRNETEVKLQLCENGTFAYYYDPCTDCHYEGYYTFNDKKIMLYSVLDCGNDPSAVIYNEVIELDINQDSSMEDKTKLNTLLIKETSNIDEVVNLSNSIMYRFNNNFLAYAEKLNNSSINKIISNSKFNSLKGIYKGNISDIYGRNETEVKLQLCENGTFAYYYDPGTACHYEGYYTLNNNILVLYLILDCGNDPGASLINKTINLNINQDSAIIDDEKLKTVLKKDTNESIENLDIDLSINYRLKNNFLVVE